MTSKSTSASESASASASASSAATTSTAQIIKSIYENHKKDVYQYLISLTHNKTLSEDLTSETFLSAMKSLPNFKGRSDIKTWLFSIARHKWYEHLRKSKATVSLDELAEHYLQDLDSLERNVVSEELLQRFHGLLQLEPERSRSIVLMRIEGYSFYEIGTTHGISENSARVIDFRVKNKLKEALRKEGLAHDEDFL